MLISTEVYYKTLLGVNGHCRSIKLKDLGYHPEASCNPAHVTPHESCSCHVPTSSLQCEDNLKCVE